MSSESIGNDRKSCQCAHFNVYGTIYQGCLVGWHFYTFSHFVVRWYRDWSADICPLITLWKQEVGWAPGLFWTRKAVKEALMNPVTKLMWLFIAIITEVMLKNGTVPSVVCTRKTEGRFSMTGGGQIIYISEGYATELPFVRGQH